MLTFGWQLFLSDFPKVNESVLGGSEKPQLPLFQPPFVLVLLIEPVWSMAVVRPLPRSRRRQPRVLKYFQTLLLNELLFFREKAWQITLFYGKSKKCIVTNGKSSFPLSLIITVIICFSPPVFWCVLLWLWILSHHLCDLLYLYSKECDNNAMLKFMLCLRCQIPYIHG